jgi:ubiquinone/menaquinone biosynthesis C-methylase UbiE
MGFDVTGVDFVPEMVENAQKNAARQGVRIEGLVQEISRLEIPTANYDVAWLSSGMYSSVPTRKRRVEMLRRIGNALRPQGLLVCQFNWGADGIFTPKVERVRKAFARLLLGNLAYERGDMLKGNREFVHAFSSWQDLDSEFEQGGFEVVYRQLSEEVMRGGAVLKRKIVPVRDGSTAGGSGVS